MRTETGMRASKEEHASGGGGSATGVNWRVEASAYAVEQPLNIARAVRLYWMDSKPLAEVAADMYLPVPIVRQLVQTGVEYCIGKYVQKRVMQIVSPELRKAIIDDLMAGLFDVTHADDQGNAPRVVPLRK
jgi:hypothetical protein